MASEVDICNLALAHLGDSATVASINPPEGSAQAEHCAQFYPVARNTLLELHTWGFATRSTSPGKFTNSNTLWNYAYMVPADLLNVIAILPENSTDDNDAKNFSLEVTSDGQQVIYSDEPNAILRYTQTVSDSARFSPLFVATLSWHLASMLAGPVLKGDVGKDESKRCAAAMITWLNWARGSDASQRHALVDHVPSHMAAR